jgi:thioredoxin-like negative regulator of GroEL
MATIWAARCDPTSRECANASRVPLANVLDLFEILPPNDERVKKARTQLTLLLF